MKVPRSRIPQWYAVVELCGGHLGSSADIVWGVGDSLLAARHDARKALKEGEIEGLDVDDLEIRPITAHQAALVLEHGVIEWPKLFSKEVRHGG